MCTSPAFDKITQETTRLRDSLFLLAPDQKDSDRKVYEELRSLHIKRWEGVRTRVYDDGKGNMTVGVGFNMDAVTAAEEWKNAFQGAVSFADIYSGNAELTYEQVEQLLGYSLRIREVYLVRIYGDVWSRLAPHQRLAIESAYYNAPSIVGVHTRFYGHMKMYAETKDVDALMKAVYELKVCSNNEKNPSLRSGLQNRRDCEADLLASYKSPLFPV